MSTPSIAVIGVGCRFPGEASSPEKLWELLVSRRDTFSLANKRWNQEAFYHPKGGKQHTIAARGAHFLSEDVLSFDAAFFNISAAEAMALDPQQRLTLEVTYEALESAGLPLEAVAGSKTACYMGNSSADYRDSISRDPDNSPRYATVGVTTEMIANRTSWFFDLKGPSMTIQTACSSSLVAIHVACRSLASGEATMAVAGGANLMLNPDYPIYLNSMNMNSKEGHCKSFDAACDGYSRGEGCGVVVLKRLSDAVRDGDPIRAVIRGTGSNSDGFTQGLTMPNAEAQATLIRDVYAAAGLDMGSTQYVEAHGTGTPAGDPIEARAIYETIGRSAGRSRKLFIGSVKPNIGHLEAAAGVAALVKSIIALEKGFIPPNLFFKTPNPAIPFDEWNLKVPTELVPWPAARTKRVSISSFGAGGTNAHVIVEAVDQRSSSQRPRLTNGTKGRSRKERLFVISSHDQGGVARVGQALAAHLEKKKGSGDDEFLGDLAYTLGARRSRLPWKTFCLASDAQELRTKLSALSGDAAVRSNSAPRLGFVFTGQGAQWARMGVELLSRYPVFAASVKECETYLAALGCPWSAVAELGKPAESSRVGEPEFSQTLCTVLQLALVDLLRAWRVLPARVVGHSSGEMAAAYCAGALSKRDAVAVAYFRGRASSKLRKGGMAPFEGGMLAAGCSQDEAEEWIEKVQDGGQLSVACVNSPSSVTISGEVGALGRLESLLQANQVFARRLKVEVAYHSDQMYAVHPEYVASLASLDDGHVSSTASGEDNPVMISSVDVDEVVPGTLGSFYWGRNLVSPVLFSEALKELVAPEESPADTAVDLLIELGPHSALGGPIKQILEKNGIKDVEYLSVLSRGKNDVSSALEFAGAAFSRGVPLDLSQVNLDPASTTLTDLPPYPWNHTRRFDGTSRLNREFCMRPHGKTSLLGAPVPAIGEREHVWRGYLRLGEESWIRDHKILSVVLFPGAGLIAMALEAARQIADPGKKIRTFKLRDISIGTAVVVNEDKPTEFLVHLRPHLAGTAAGSGSAAAWFEFTVSTSTGNDMPVRENCHGLISVNYAAAGGDEHMQREIDASVQSRLRSFSHAAQSCPTPIDVEGFYSHLSSIGVDFGPTFRNLTGIRAGPGQSVVEVTVGDPGETFSSGQSGRPHIIHPTTLDSVISAPLVALYQGREPPSQAHIPIFIEELEIAHDIPVEPGTRLKGNCTLKERGPGECVFDIDVFDEALERGCLSFRGYRTTSEISGESPQNANASNPCYTISWEHDVETLAPQELQRIIEGVPGDNDQRIIKLANMILHAKPDSNILELLPGEPDENTAAATISGTLQTARPDQVKYAVADEPSPSSTNSKIIPDPIFLGSSTAANNPHFDLIIVPQQCAAIENFGVALSRLADLLKPTGKLLCGLNQSTLENQPSLRAELSIADSDGPLTIYSHTSQPNNQPPAKNEALIIESAMASADAISFREELVKTLQGRGLNVETAQWDASLSEKVASRHCISLLELEASCLESLSAPDFALVKDTILKTASLLWITAIAEPFASIAAGLLRPIRREMSGQQELRLLQLSSSTTNRSSTLQQRAQLAARVFQNPIKEEHEFREDGDGVLKTGRIAQDAPLNSLVRSHMGAGAHAMHLKDCDFPLKLGIGRPGLLDTLYFGPHDALMRPLEMDEVEIEVAASGMNFRDVMISMGLIAGSELGYEASGIVRATGSRVTKVKTGDRVSAHVRGGHATVVRTKDFLCAPVPDALSMEEAAAMPVVFTTAYHALVNTAKLRPGQSVLIHAAAGGVGQAAVQLSKHLGLTVYATVGSPQKRKLLVDVYGVPDSHIFHSRDASFALAVKRVTGGRGVDCVLNSLAGELLRQSFYCLAPLGTFVEIGSRDVTENTRLDMRPFAASTTFACLNLLDLITEAPQVMEDAFRATFDLVRQGVLSPPSPLTVLPVHAVHEAFRLMQSGTHLGKLVLSFKDNGLVPVMRSPHNALRLDPDSTILLVGGFGGLGRSLARMLVESGARNLAFVSRSGANSAGAQALLDDLTQRGVSAKVYSADIADESALSDALHLCSTELPPIKHVVQMAMVLQDSPFETMTHSQWAASVRPKIQGTWNLHRHFDASRRPQLDSFTIFSSISGILGNKAQANYAAASAFQDALAHARRSAGLRCVSVDLGIMLDVGVIAEKGATGDLKRWEDALGVREPLFHGLIRTVINGQQRRRSSGDDDDDDDAFPPQVCVGLGTADVFDAAGIARPDFLEGDARFAWLAVSTTGVGGGGGGNAGGDGSSAGGGGAQPAGASASASLRVRLGAAPGKAEAVEIITDGLVAKISDILQIPGSEVDAGRPMYLYGVDSLVAMEVRNWVKKEMGAQVAIFDILESVPMAQFAQKIAERTSLLKKAE